MREGLIFLVYPLKNMPLSSSFEMRVREREFMREGGNVALDWPIVRGVQWLVDTLPACPKVFMGAMRVPHLVNLCLRRFEGKKHAP